MEPVLKWAGGKRLLAPKIEKLWFSKPHTQLIEPFAGGLAVSFHILPTKAVVNDINPHLMNFYHHLRQGLTIDIPFENTQECYYEARNTLNEMIRNNAFKNKDAAQLFYYLNRQGYNGLCRFNSDGEFNTPFGKYKKLNVKNDLTEYANAMQGWEITSQDFSTLQPQPGDFVYCDPPYLKVNFTKYSQNDFKQSDHGRLLDWAKQLPCSVVISNSYTPEIKKMYEQAGFTIELLEARRTIACNGDRKPVVEILACKNL